MAAVDNIFIKHFSDEIKIAYQQSESLVMGTTTLLRGITGSTAQFPVLGSVVATSKTRNGDITPLNPDHQFVTATLVDKYAAIYWDRMDQNKSNIQMRAYYAKVTANAINRAVDANLITTLTGGTPSVTATSGLTFDKLLEAKTLLAQAEAYNGELYLIVSPKQISDMLKDPKLTSRDYTTLMGAQTGKISEVMGFNVIQSNLLPVASNVRSCVMYNKSAVGCATGEDLKTLIERVPEKDSTLISTTVSMGSVIIDPAGVIEIACTEA
jgi:hypothetical protein